MCFNSTKMTQTSATDTNASSTLESIRNDVCFELITPVALLAVNNR